jgi:hypothetical protein
VGHWAQGHQVRKSGDRIPVPFFRAFTGSLSGLPEHSRCLRFPDANREAPTISMPPSCKVSYAIPSRLLRFKFVGSSLLTEQATYICGSFFRD